jgi:hypothetical protein
MRIALKLAHQPSETNLMTVEADYSIYPLRQLLAARHEFDANGHSNRVRWLEEEIQKALRPFSRSKRAQKIGICGDGVA